jgi:ABC-type histidine transport system ATPase subunit
MKYLVDEISFESFDSYLDVVIMHDEKWIKVTTDGSFSIASQEELDIIYKKLSKIFKKFKKQTEMESLKNITEEN